jgi:hypothetical protein
MQLLTSVLGSIMIVSHHSRILFKSHIDAATTTHKLGSLDHYELVEMHRSYSDYFSLDHFE